MKDLSKDSVTLVEIGEESAGQRIDNFLTRHLKGVPKSHIYRILRSGEVRVNKKRVDQTCRLQSGDLLRIPPVRLAEKSQDYVPAAEFPVLYEDDALLAINKPAGVAVHGGSGVSFGVIEQLRQSRPQAKFLELVHRLARETSGILLLAKKRSALTALHEQMREGKTDKRYLVLVIGHWKNAKQHVRLPLHKFTRPD
ncbi:MAG: RNA pseudouridine synthase, partial [Gallionellaceae bacterium]|nr:RNA pseudouridine synthase [Gallionellaceae bacterium]